MKKSLKFLIFLLFVFSMLVNLSPEVMACGGFFCTTSPIDQNAERIIFTVNGDGTITAVVGINYVGEAEDFSWVVPVPSPPDLDVAETASLDRLQNATNVWFVNPPNYCRGLLWTNGGLGGGGGGEVIEGSVGPYDYAIIRNEDPDELVMWLRDNGYQVTEDMEPIIADYVEDEMYFLAMKLSQDAEVGDIQPIVMTYESEKPMIPLKLTAVAAVDDMPVLVWIFADQQYVPENYAHPQPDYGNMTAPSQITVIREFSIPSAFNSTYSREQSRIQADYDGLAFITEYAQSSAQLLADPEIPSGTNFFFGQQPQSVQGDPLLEDLVERFPYVTRLRAQLSPEQMTLDPTFIPDPNAEDVSNRVDLIDHTDPLHYWGCSSRRLEIEYEEMTAHTRIGEVAVANETGDRTINAQFDIAHPEGWVLSELTVNTVPVWVVAPQAVDMEDINAYIAGEDAPPMFIAVMESTIPNFAEQNWWSTSRIFLGLFEAEDFPELGDGYWRIFSRRPTLYGTQENPEGYLDHISFGMLTTATDGEANEDLYRAMMDHARRYQYFSHPELQHTLFLGTEYIVITENYDAVPWSGSIGYPSDWIEYWSDEGYAYVTPLNAVGDDDGPVVKMMPLSNLTQSDLLPRNIDELLGFLETRYDLSAEQLAELREGNDPIYEGYEIDMPIMPFEMDGRRGYFRVTGRYLVEASIVVGDDSVDDETFFAILESAEGWKWLR